MCLAVAGVAAEQQNPGFRSGMFPQNGLNNSLGVPYTWGAGFPIANTPTKNLANNAIGNKERERRNTASNSTSSSSSNLSIRKESSSTKKRSVSSGSSKTSKSKRFSTR
jgi:hypothetical protein